MMNPEDAATRSTKLPSNSPLARLRLAWPFVAALLLAAPAWAQTMTGPQQLTFAGLRSVGGQGQIDGVKADAAGNLYLLIDQRDGVRVLKTDAAAANILAESQLGGQGDHGIALALDPAGNVYVAGTTTSGTLGGTGGAAFPQRADTSTNSFVAKYDANLNPVFVTFAGSGRLAATAIAATADAVFVTGSLFAATLPVTPNAIQQTPLQGSFQNGFVERFSADGSTLVYATYLTGANGDSSPAAIVADGADNAYIAGYTTASGFPTIAALVPRIPAAAAGGAPAAGFLTKLTALGDGIVFSTFVPGNGVSSLALDSSAGNLLLSGDVALGQFPVATVQMPVVATAYQVLARLALDGSAVLSSTLLAPGTQSFVAASTNGGAWVDGTLTAPLLPLTPLSDVGSAFAVRVAASGAVDQTARLGGLATDNLSSASAPVTLTAVGVDAAGEPLLAGAFMPTASTSLLATETYDLPLENAPTGGLPSTVNDAALPAGSCQGSLCAASAGYLARLKTGVAAPALALSSGALPDVVLRNLGSAQAAGVQIMATGFTVATTCGGTLDAGGECSIALSGAGPGTITVLASNAPAQTASLAAVPAGTAPASIVFSPHELDFGVQTASSGPAMRTITVTNLSQQTQIFTSGSAAITRGVTLPFSEASSDCAPSGASSTTGNKQLEAGASCHITLAFALNATVVDGYVQMPWTVASAGTRGVMLTGFAQAAALGVSSAGIDFGTQFAGGLRSARFLYLSNNSDAPIGHAEAGLPAGSPFTITDRCAATLLAHSVCQIELGYAPAAQQTDDAATLFLDQGLTVPVTGRTTPQPGVGGSGVNPNLSVTPMSVHFTNAVPVTGVSTATQTVTITNTGASAFALGLTLSGDFTDTTNCGSTLGAMSNCSVVLSFAPAAPGVREGLLAITGGAGTDPVYVDLSGTGTAILPMNNGTLDFGGVPVTQPAVRWFKVSQPFQTLTARTSGAFKAILVEDIGFGHGNPGTGAFRTDFTGSCLNCFIGVQFRPADAGAQAGTLSLFSASITTPYVLTLTGTGLPLFGALVAPYRQDYGTVPVHSTSVSYVFALTNEATPAASITVTQPTVTGDFAVVAAPTGGAACAGQLAPGATCLVAIAFSPTAVGPRTGTISFQTPSGTATAALTGFGSPDPGVSLSPNALIFTNVPGSAATQQTVTIGNTGSSTIQVGPLAVSTSGFTVTSGCGSLAPGATCTAMVTYLPAGAPSAGVLQIPVAAVSGGAQATTTYTVPLTGAYTSVDAGLQIVPGDVDFGPALTGSPGQPRTFTVNNLTAKAVALSLLPPRQFALSEPNPCPALAPNGSCNFTVIYLPVTSADVTGTIFAEGKPSDDSGTLHGLAYFAGYGSTPVGSAISFGGPLSPGTGILDFGQVTSGQTLAKTLTLTNSSGASGPVAAQNITIRRITSNAPFLSTTTCGATLTPGALCAVTVTYSPLNEVASGSPATPAAQNSGVLTVESDATSSPDAIDLSGFAAPLAVSAPATGATVATFALSQGSFTFDPTAVGNVSAARTVTLSNTGNVTLHLGTVQATAGFTVVNGCPQAVVAGGTCTLSVTFTPQANGVRSGTLSIASDSTTSLDFVSLFGVSSPSSILVATAALDFGTVQVGAAAALPVQITNNGLVPVTVEGITATGDYTAAGSCPAAGGTLAPATSCTVEVSFVPSAAGTRTGTLNIATTATTLPLTVALTGVGTQSHLQITPGALAFGSIAVGAPANLSLTLANTGTAPILGLTLAVAGDYAITVPCTATTLAPGQRCAVTVTFTPSAVGPRPGSLTVTSSDSPSPVVVPLTGMGVVSASFTLTVNGGSTATSTVKSGNPASYTLTVTPTGGFSGSVVLNCTPLNPVAYANCSMLPSSLLLAGSAQNAALTINTVTSAQAASLVGRGGGDTLLCVLAPGLLLLWRRRRFRHPGGLLWVVAAAILTVTAIGCGGGPNPNLRYANPGSYQYQITASSTSGVQITQSVTVTIDVTN